MVLRMTRFLPDPEQARNMLVAGTGMALCLSDRS